MEVVRTSHLRIGVRTGLGDKKVIFEDVVNISKVYDALKCLKYDYKNYLYQKLDIPSTIEEFRAKIAEKPVEIFEMETETKLQIAIDDTNSTDAESVVVLETSDKNKTKPMLSQINQEELDQYKSCSIMPLNNERKPSKTSSLYKFERVEGEALRSFEVKDLDLRCFPDLFPDAKYGQNDPARKIPISESAYAKARLRSINPKFKQKKSYLFHLHNKQVMRELSSGIFSTTNIHTFDKNMTTEFALNKIQRGDLDKPISSIFSKVRGTQEYFKIPKWNLETMIRNYGPATWFLTFSPTEWLWPDLKAFLLEVNPNLDSSKTIAELCSLDPFGMSMYVNHRFEAILKFLHGPDNPIGKIRHFFLRREYQNRCVTHFHYIFWVEKCTSNRS